LKSCSKKNEKKILKSYKEWNYFAGDKEHIKKENVNILTPEFAAKKCPQPLLNCDTRVLENLLKKPRKCNIPEYAGIIRW